MKGWLDYWRAVSDRISWDRSLLRGLWIVPWLHWRLQRNRLKRKVRIAYYPQPAGPWYTMPLAAKAVGYGKTRDVSNADIVMIFDDQTVSKVDLPDVPGRLLNAAATDISKAHVGDIFMRTFGYALSVDPRTHQGVMVQKSDRNGVHDGRIVEGPLTDPHPECAYQRLIDSRVGNGVTEDLRCVCIGGDVVQVFRKEKDESTRFAAIYRQTTLENPAETFSLEERASIQRFCQMIGLDFGSIDILRDYSEGGRLYIVDVNKTCMPVLSMPVAELEKALGNIGNALDAYMVSRELDKKRIS